MLQTLYSTLDSVQDWITRRRIERRRRKLVSAYAKVGRVRHGLGPGLSPTMYAYDQLLQEGLMVVVEDGDSRRMVWNWPEDADGRVVAEAEPRDDEQAVEWGEVS